MLTKNAVAAAVETTADERWAAWVARGKKQTQETNKRMTLLAAAIFSGFGIWLASLVLRG